MTTRRMFVVIPDETSESMKTNFAMSLSRDRNLNLGGSRSVARASLDGVLSDLRTDGRFLFSFELCL